MKRRRNEETDNRKHVGCLVRNPSDLELLKIQTLDLSPQRGSVAGLYGFVIACTGSEEELWIGSEVPAGLAGALAAAQGDALPRTDPADPPSTLEVCELLLSAGGCSLRRDAGPSYLIESDSRFTSGARVERSDLSSTDSLRASNPGNWEPIEWDELLDGCLGPWAMATAGDRIISICHTPRPMTDTAAECGVWTDPDFRGRGHAAAVTSEWAAILRPSGRYLFYSTSAENLSSRRVAGRLSLHLLGWIWRVGQVRNEPDDGVHPLSELRRQA
ncbi:MAG TPA: GNAT family protein, partial [Polyangiaceae bacterium]